MGRRFTPGLAFHAFTPLYNVLTEALGYGRPFRQRVEAALRAVQFLQAVKDADAP